MKDPRDLTIPLPMLDEAAAALRTKGEYEAELSDAELGAMMRSIVESLIASQSVATARVVQASARILDGRGTGTGVVQVLKPVEATVQLVCTLRNSADPESIELENLKVKQEGGFAAKLALKAVNLEGRAREALADPNQALSAALASQLQPRGARLTSLATHFGDSTLHVRMRGGPA